MSNKYAELRQKQQEEFNALPLGFAFGNKQFDGMMQNGALTRRKTSTRFIPSGTAGTYRKRTPTSCTRPASATMQKCRQPLRGTRLGRGSSMRCFSMSWTITNTATHGTRRTHWTRWATRRRRCWANLGSREASKRPSRRFAGGIGKIHSKQNDA